MSKSLDDYADEKTPKTKSKAALVGKVADLIQRSGIDVDEIGRIDKIVVGDYQAITKDIVLEVEAPLPAGKIGNGFYNLNGDSPLHGHLRADNCKAIVFLRRPFMGTETLSVQFFNAAGEAMFKVFVGRDEKRALKPDQVERFARLAARFGTAEAL